MVRSGVRRSEKYRMKIDGDVIKNRIDAERDYMVAQATDAFAVQEAVENTVKGIASVQALGTVFVPFCIAFGRQCKKVLDKWGVGTQGTAEVEGFGLLWNGRGIDSGALTDIATEYGFAVTIP